MLKSLSLLALTIALVFGLVSNSAAHAAVTAEDEARAIAKEAYIYGYPMVDNYRVEYAYFVDRQDPEFKAPWNQITNIPRVFTPADTAIQTPNSDTPIPGSASICVPNPSSSPCRRLRSSAITASSSPTRTRSTLPTSAAAPPATMAAASSSPDRIGKARRQRA